LHRFDFSVESVESLKLVSDKALSDSDLMSPFVWKQPDGLFGLMVRSVPKVMSPSGVTGAIFHGVGSDGVNFEMSGEPCLAPGPGALDVGGCEDPTVVIVEGEYVVYYTGVDQTRSSGQMLYATGPDPRHLTKRGVAMASSKTEGNVKEATIDRTAHERWRLFYEYARNDASLIGLAIGKGVAGPWIEHSEPLKPRPDCWDSWHLSTGPLLTTDKSRPIMFYNGATRDARWRIGWAAFDRDCKTVVDRCIEPMIVPPPPSERTGIDIAFAASVIQDRGRIYLYYSLADKTLHRSLIRRS
jgi:predicted GH43/DUF377 family glycosyl hydrolase